MRNIEMKLEGDNLIIQIDLTREYGMSRTGRTIIVASTGGSVPIPFQGVPDGLALNATLYKSMPRREESGHAGRVFPKDPFP